MVYCIVLFWLLKLIGRSFLHQIRVHTSMSTMMFGICFIIVIVCVLTIRLPGLQNVVHKRFIGRFDLLKGLLLLFGITC